MNKWKRATYEPFPRLKKTKAAHCGKTVRESSYGIF
jgi:hypothetical protein